MASPLNTWFKNESLENNYVTLQETVNLTPKSCLKRKSQNSTDNCIFCFEDTHTSHECRIYERPSEFHKDIFRKFSCYNCLEAGHKSYACPQLKICCLCDDSRKHSPVICKRNYAQI